MNENINFKKYSDRVLANESVVENCLYDVERLKRAAQLVAISNQILNQVKREIFYKKTDPEKYEQLNLDLKEAVNTVQEPNEKPLEDIISLRVLHSFLGLNTESSELLESAIKVFNGQVLDNKNVNEEFGDVLWYQAVLVDSLKLNLNSIMQTNALKLEKRFKKGFSFEQAIHRDLEAEKKILEEE